MAYTPFLCEYIVSFIFFALLAFQTSMLGAAFCILQSEFVCMKNISKMLQPFTSCDRMARIFFQLYALCFKHNFDIGKEEEICSIILLH